MKLTSMTIVYNYIFVLHRTIKQPNSMCEIKPDIYIIRSTFGNTCFHHNYDLSSASLFTTRLTTSPTRGMSHLYLSHSPVTRNSPRTVTNDGMRDT